MVDDNNRPDKFFFETKLVSWYKQYLVLEGHSKYLEHLTIALWYYPFQK